MRLVREMALLYIFVSVASFWKGDKNIGIEKELIFESGVAINRQSN
jgi:hypothetical protein